MFAAAASHGGRHVPAPHRNDGSHVWRTLPSHVMTCDPSGVHVTHSPGGESPPASNASPGWSPGPPPDASPGTSSKPLFLLAPHASAKPTRVHARRRVVFMTRGFFTRSGARSPKAV